MAAIIFCLGHVKITVALNTTTIRALSTSMQRVCFNLGRWGKPPSVSSHTLLIHSVGGLIVFVLLLIGRLLCWAMSIWQLQWCCGQRFFCFCSCQCRHFFFTTYEYIYAMSTYTQKNDSPKIEAKLVLLP